MKTLFSKYLVNRGKRNSRPQTWDKTGKRKSPQSSSYEQLESRQLLAVITVDTTSMVADGSIDGVISLGEAIIATNTNAGFGDAPAGDATGDSIQFSPSLNDATITLDGSELQITDDLIIRGNASNITISGGDASRIFSVNTSEQVVFSKLNLSDGFATEGGAILTRGGGITRLFQTTFDSNVANGIRSGGGAVFNLDSRLFVANSTFTNNIGVRGGAIFTVSDLANIYESTFTGNQARIAGGAMATGNGDLFFNRSEIADNLVSQNIELELDFDDGLLGDGTTTAVGSLQGGGIAFMGDSATIMMLTTTVDNNLADGAGGGIWLGEGNELLAFADTRVRGNNSLLSLNGIGGGGGIYSAGTIRAGNIDVANNTSSSSSGGGLKIEGGDVRISNSRFIDNSTMRNGGAIANVDGKLDLFLVRFVRNIAGAVPAGTPSPDFTPHQSPSGGGISTAGSAEIGIFNSDFQGNIAHQNGGAISHSAETMLITGGSLFVGNQALASDPAIPFGRGGAIDNTGDSLKIYSSTLRNNTVFNQIGEGGAISSSGANLEMGFTKVELNFSEGNGGGITVSEGTASLYAMNFYANRAGIPGAANGVSGGDGGAINATGPATVTVFGGEIQSNVATKNGGGISIGRDATLSIRTGHAEVLNPIVHNNRALAGDGGGINSLGDLNIRDTLFENNSSRNGGGLFIDEGLFRMANSTVQENEARQFGGGLYLRGVATPLSNSVIDNMANFGENIFVDAN